MKNKDLYLGVDIALNTTGYAVMGYDKKIFKTGLIKTKQSLDYYGKLVFLYEEFVRLFLDLQSKNPNSITLILEGRLQGGFSGQTLASIEGARVACFLAYKHTVGKEGKFYVYNPSEIKYHFSRKRGAKKQEMYDSVIKSYKNLQKLDFQEDIFDAIYLCLYKIETETG
jgi:Holliday junction resolvasome RuvABC endonuclease subunit